MKNYHVAFKQWLIFFYMIVWLPLTLNAQLISIKTAPVATGDQFLLYPSQNLGMGGVSIALNDTLYDPFVNPAKGFRMRGALLFGAPTFYSVSSDQGAARTLPLGVLYGSQRWFGGGTLSLQQLDMVSPDRPVQLLSEKFSTNIYMSGFLGKKLPGTNSAVGMGFFWADLTGVDGVDMLYPRSRDLVQYGHIVDIRMGFINDGGGERQLELLLLHHRVKMTHDVTYENWIWDESLDQSIPTLRREKNLDRSNTWGIHLGYQRPFWYFDSH